jgi:hypothetical protein
MSQVFVILILLLIFVVPAIFQWLWNITCPDVFRLPTLTYWQAFRLLILATLLFGGLHFATQSSGSWSFGI